MKYILVTDDEPTNQIILQEALSDEYEVQCADNGNDCLKSIEQRIPDLLLLDLSMPDINGLEVCRILRASDKTVDLPILVLTGHATNEHREMVLQAGASGFIGKPFEITTLYEAIEEYL